MEMTKTRMTIVSVLLFGAAFGAWLHLTASVQQGLTLYGNIDQRQVELAFIDSERIAEMLVQEGMRVEPGQILARLETRRLRDTIAVAEAQTASAEASLLRLKNGTRPEEIEQARAVVASAEAELMFATAQYKRYSSLATSSSMAVSKQDVEEALLRLNTASAKLIQEQLALQLAEIGPRQEDIAEAESALLANTRDLERLRNQLADAELTSPACSVISRRLMEPGDMALPQKPVFSLAVLSPKWVRAYVSEPDLGRIRYGMNAVIHTDSHPDESISGTVGFISSVAEFTPKMVQTPELRTSLVYEVRIYVEDREDRLRLGMPVTVNFPQAAE
jgi:HlyD family secretion protein